VSAPPVAEGDVVRMGPGPDSGRRYEVVRISDLDGVWARVAPLAEDDRRDLFWVSVSQLIKAG
jgi:hypothetical protein